MEIDVEVSSRSASGLKLARGGKAFGNIKLVKGYSSITGRCGLSRTGCSPTAMIQKPMIIFGDRKLILMILACSWAAPFSETEKADIQLLRRPGS